MKNALDDINAAFTKDTGITVAASYAASSALMKQTEQGAPGFGQRSYLRDTHTSLFASFQRPAFSTDPG
jgi:hypothetical protein